MKVLISAYACEPNKGSEPGVGWNWARAAAAQNDVWVLTRSNNRSSLEAALLREPTPSLHFVYLDLPPWLRFWKRGRHGVRVYYNLWQLAAGTKARRMHAERQFDVVHHLTFANAWLPALVCAAPAPFVLGPVSGGQSVPLRLFPVLGTKASAFEILLRLGRLISRLNPLVRIGWNRACVILVNNEETRDALPSRYRRKTLLRTNASVEAPSDRASPPARINDGIREPTAIYAGRLNPFKGVSLAIDALRLAPEWRLVIVGGGRDAERLRRLASRAAVADRITFMPWLPREQLMSQIAGADALLLPSLKEGASFVAVEAQSLGVPVVALGQGGPAQLACTPGAQFELVGVGSRQACIRGFAEALERLRVAPRPTTWPDFGLGEVERDIEMIYRRVIGEPGLFAEVTR